MTDEQALLAAILAHPEDDLPRLVYADWLDEQGNESDAARAAFIRVGCEIAELERERVCRFNDAIDWKECTDISATWCGNCGDCSCKNREESMSDKGCPLHDPTSKHCCLEMLEYKESRLRKRERELLGPWKPGSYGENQFKWFVDNPVGRVLYAAEYAGPTIRRGFVESIRLPLAAFLGGPCERCGGTGFPGGEPSHMMEHSPRLCRYCLATGRTEGIAKRLGESQPVLSVTLSDQSPYPLNRDERVAWFHPGVPNGREPSIQQLPEDVFNALEGHENQGPNKARVKWYHTREAANAALSTVLVALARSLAHLPPLRATPPAQAKATETGPADTLADVLHPASPHAR